MNRKKYLMKSLLPICQRPQPEAGLTGQLLAKPPRTEDTHSAHYNAPFSASSAVCPTREPVPAEGRVPDPEAACLAQTADRRCKHRMVLTLKVSLALGDPLPHEVCFNGT